jgi:HEAT repeat protein
VNYYYLEGHPFPDGAIDKETEFVESCVKKLRIKTAETLGQIGHASAIPVLGDLIRRKGRIFSTAEPTELRLAAARALTAIGTPPAFETLRKLVEEEPRSRDRDALQQILDTPRRPQGTP